MKKILSVMLGVIMLISIMSVGISASAEENSINLIGSSFEGFDATTWTTSTADSIVDGKLQAAPSKGTNTAETVSSFALGKSFEVEFYAVFRNGYTNYYGEHTSVTVGGIEMRISNIKNDTNTADYKLELYIDGTAVATYALGDSPNGNYSFKLRDGVITAKFKGSVIAWTIGELTNVEEIDAADINITDTKIKAVIMNNYDKVYNRYLSDFIIYGGDNGDFDFDGCVTSSDALVAQQALLGLGGAGTLADVDHDGKVTSIDYLKLKGHALGVTLVDGYEYNPVKILCVGDSITAGTGALSAWRYGLYENLYKAGANFRLVGGKTTTADFRLPVGYQGYSATGGDTTQDILDKADTYFSQDFDVFAMQIGYNDYGHPEEIDIETSIANYKAILDLVYSKNPDAHAYVSTMCPCRPFINKQDEWLTTGINAHLDSIVEEYKAAGKNITKVNNITGYGWIDDDFPQLDGVHPNEQGLRKIAAAFYDAMKDDVKSYNLGYSYKRNPTVHVDSISLNTNNISVEVGAAKSVVATISPVDSTINTVLWSSDNDAVATVTDNGRITGITEGTCNITATSLDGGHTKTVAVTVTASTEAPKTQVFASNFSTLDGWTGSDGTEFKSSWTKACTVGMVSWTGTLTSNTTYSNNGNFKFEFTYNTSGNESAYGDNFYGSVSYAGFELRAIDVNRKVALYYNGEQLGIYSSVACIRPTVFSMTYIDGVATAYIDSEAVISAEVTDVAAESSLVYTHTQKWRNCYLKNLNLYTYN